LKEINADTKNIIYVFNKVDLLIDEEKQNIINKLYKEFSNSVFISAHKGINLSSLYELIIENIKSNIAEFEIKIPANDPNSYKILNILHKETEILSIKYFSKIIKIKLRGNKISIEAIVHRYFNGNINKNINRPLIKNKIRKELAGAE
jgi:50S ribosomal subunit-associated GTPase HflX